MKPALTPFVDKTSLRGAMISAVDLLKGIGKGAGMDVIEVNGATGNWDTNFLGKGEAALKALETNDFCYIHVEAPDECGHRGEAERKVYSIEMIDKDIIGTIVNGLTAKHEDFALMFLPDHPTPCSIKTHSRNPVPFLMYSSRENLAKTTTSMKNGKRHRRVLRRRSVAFQRFHKTEITQIFNPKRYENPHANCAGIFPGRDKCYYYYNEVSSLFLFLTSSSFFNSASRPLQELQHGQPPQSLQQDDFPFSCARGSRR